MGNDPPDFPAAALAAGDALTAEDGSGTTGSSIGARITYPDGKVAEIRLVNPIIGTPEADWRTGPSDVDWVNGEQNYASLDEGESATASVEGHTIRFNRLADDDDNKNWTVSLA